MLVWSILQLSEDEEGVSERSSQGISKVTSISQPVQASHKRLPLSQITEMVIVILH